MPRNDATFQIVFGATETSPVFSSTNPDEPMDLWIRTVGTPLDHVEVGKQGSLPTFDKGHPRNSQCHPYLLECFAGVIHISINCRAVACLKEELL